MLRLLSFSLSQLAFTLQVNPTILLDRFLKLTHQFFTVMPNTVVVHT